MYVFASLYALWKYIKKIWFCNKFYKGLEKIIIIVKSVGLLCFVDTQPENNISILIIIQRTMIFPIEKKLPLDQLQLSNGEIIAQVSSPLIGKWNHRTHVNCHQWAIVKINSDEVPVSMQRRATLRSYIIGFLWTCHAVCLPAGSGVFETFFVIIQLIDSV